MITSRIRDMGTSCKLLLLKWHVQLFLRWRLFSVLVLSAVPSHTDVKITHQWLLGWIYYAQRPNVTTALFRFLSRPTDACVLFFVYFYVHLGVVSLGSNFALMTFWCYRPGSVETLCCGCSGAHIHSVRSSLVQFLKASHQPVRQDGVFICFSFLVVAEKQTQVLLAESKRGQPHLVSFILLTWNG